MAASFLMEIKGKLLMAELASKLGKLSVGDDAIKKWKSILVATQDLVRQGILSYGLVVAQKPA